MKSAEQWDLEKASLFRIDRNQNFRGHSFHMGIGGVVKHNALDFWWKDLVRGEGDFRMKSAEHWDLEKASLFRIDLNHNFRGHSFHMGREKETFE